MCNGVSAPFGGFGSAQPPSAQPPADQGTRFNNGVNRPLRFGLLLIAAIGVLFIGILISDFNALVMVLGFPLLVTCVYGLYLRDVVYYSGVEDRCNEAETSLLRNYDHQAKMLGEIAELKSNNKKLESGLNALLLCVDSWVENNNKQVAENAQLSSSLSEGQIRNDELLLANKILAEQNDKYHNQVKLYKDRIGVYLSANDMLERRVKEMMAWYDAANSLNHGLKDDTDCTDFTEKENELRIVSFGCDIEGRV